MASVVANIEWDEAAARRIARLVAEGTPLEEAAAEAGVRMAIVNRWARNKNRKFARLLVDAFAGQGGVIGKVEISPTRLREAGPEILLRMASGESLSSICQPPMPSLGAVLLWAIENRADGFTLALSSAREAQGMAAADRVLELAGGVVAGIIDPATALAAFRMLSWVAETHAPGIYGKRAQLQVTAARETIEQIGAGMSVERATEIYQQMLTRDN